GRGGGIGAGNGSGAPTGEVLAGEPPPAAAEPAPTIVPPAEEPTTIAPVAAVPPAVEAPSIEPAPPPPPRVEPVPQTPEREAASSAQIIALSRRARRWRGTALAIAALAAAFAGVVVVREVKPELMPDPLKPRVVERQGEGGKNV